MKSVIVFLSVACMLLSSLSQAAPAISLIPLTKGLIGAPSVRALLANESAKVSGPDFSATSPTALPDAAAAFGNNLLFYAFFNTYRDPESVRAYAIQRIRKTATSYRSVTDSHPVVSIEYLVEVFKTRNGALKRADVHHGTYPISGFFKRTVVKELEVGTGEIPLIAVGNTWPFEPNILYKLVQDYSANRAAYDSVRFERSVAWRIDAEFSSDGRYEVRAPELQVQLGSGR
ncbi:hypothetical protein WDW37_16640 [Bdellovibrionota bacterium FG-1]